jgi:phage-related protein
MERKAVRWMGDSRKRLREFPEAVRFEIGQVLYQAELGERHPSACAMQGLNAVEIVSDYRGDTYSGIYTTRLKGFIYVLHCFQKKSKAGIKTPKRDLELIRRRLAEAELDCKAIIEEREE